MLCLVLHCTNLCIKYSYNSVPVSHFMMLGRIILGARNIVAVGIGIAPSFGAAEMQ